MFFFDFLSWLQINILAEFEFCLIFLDFLDLVTPSSKILRYSEIMFPTQIGYVVSGRVRFIGATESDTFEASAGDAYVLGPEVPHGAEALEDTVYIEVFSPSREEYQDF